MNTASTSIVARCPKCGANNRIAAGTDTRRQPVCGRCKEPLRAAAAEPVIVTDANFGKLVERSAVPVLLDMWAAWCGPCRLIAPTIEALAKELTGRVLVGKLDVDANPRTAQRFGVQSIPTLLILNNGREVDRIVGLQSNEAILKRVQPLI